MMYPRLQLLLIVVAALGACTRLDPSARESRLAGRDRIAIDRLHQQDIDATLSDRADDLVQLWDRDAVRLQQGSPAEVGRDTIYRDDGRWEGTKTGRSLSHIKDIQVAGDWAFEWRYFEASYTESAQASPTTIRGKQLRVLKRQPDGSWKFARVMTLVDSRGSAEIKR